MMTRRDTGRDPLQRRRQWASLSLALGLVTTVSLPAAQAVKVETATGESIKGVVRAVSGKGLELTTLGTNVTERTIAFPDLHRLEVGERIEDGKHAEEAHAAAKVPDYTVAHDDFADRKPERTGPHDVEWVIAQNLEPLAVIDVKAKDDPADTRALNLVAKGGYLTLAGLFAAPEGIALGQHRDDKLELTIDFRWRAPVTADSQIRFGLFNHQGAPGIAWDKNTWGKHTGYGFRLRQDGDKVFLFKEYGEHGSVSGGSDTAGLPTQVNIETKKLYPERQRLVFTLTRLANRGVGLAVALNGTTIAAGFDDPEPQGEKDPPGVYDVFHELAISAGAQRDAALWLYGVTLKKIPAGASPAAEVAAAPPGEGALWVANLGDSGELIGRIKAWDQEHLTLAILGHFEDAPLAVPASRILSLKRHDWQDKELTRPGAEGDSVFVEVGEGQVQRVSGSVLGVDDDALLFNYKGQDRRITLTKVVGIRLEAAGAATGEDAFHLAAQLTSGSLIPGHWQGATDEAVLWQTTWGREIALPWKDLKTMRAVNGRLQYLSDLKPVDVKQVPFFDRVLPWRVDQSLNGSGLILTKAQDIPYAHGVSVYSRTELTYDLAGKFEQFNSTIGFQYPEGQHGNIDLTILGDRKPLIQEKRLQGNQTQDLSLDVTGVRELTLVVDFGEGQDVGDHFVFADAKLLRKKKE